MFLLSWSGVEQREVRGQCSCHSQTWCIKAAPSAPGGILLKEFSSQTIPRKKWRGKKWRCLSRYVLANGCWAIVKDFGVLLGSSQVFPFVFSAFERVIFQNLPVDSEHGGEKVGQHDVQTFLNNKSARWKLCGKYFRDWLVFTTQ